MLKLKLISQSIMMRISCFRFSDEKFFGIKKNFHLSFNLGHRGARVLHRSFKSSGSRNTDRASFAGSSAESTATESAAAGWSRNSGTNCRSAETGHLQKGQMCSVRSYERQGMSDVVIIAKHSLTIHFRRFVTCTLITEVMTKIYG